MAGEGGSVGRGSRKKETRSSMEGGGRSLESCRPMAGFSFYSEWVRGPLRASEQRHAKSDTSFNRITLAAKLRTC